MMKKVFKIIFGVISYPYFKQNVTSIILGIDQLLKEKQSKLEEIKSSSYYQRKKTQVEILEDSKVERSENLVGEKFKLFIH